LTVIRAVKPKNVILVWRGFHGKKKFFPLDT